MLRYWSPLFIIMAIIPGLPGKIIDNIVVKLGLQSAVDKLPTDLVPTIQPVMEVIPKPFVNIVVHHAQTAEATGTVFTTPSDREFFLTGYILTHNDQNGDNYILKATLESGEEVILFRNFPGGTSSIEIIPMNFTIPIKLKKGTNITLQLIGSGDDAFITITGYTEEIL